MKKYNKIISEDEVMNSNEIPPTSSKFVSKVGQKSGQLEVFKFAGRDSYGKLQYFCKCSCGNFVIRTAANLTPSRSKQYSRISCGCQMNSDKRLPLEEMITRVKTNTNYEIVSASELWTSKWTLRCKEHGDFLINYSSVQDGSYGCPSCSSFGFNPNRDSYFYINQILDDSGNIVAYKYGITNQPIDRRMRQIVVNSNYKIKNTFLLKENGNDLREFEKLVKKLIPSGYLTKEQISSGFTETIHPLYFIILANLIKHFIQE